MSARWASGIRTAVLGLGATLGVLCLLWSLAFPVLGVRALVVMSGSMSPAIEPGAVAFSREVPARSVEVGDVVSVTTESGRVTHRVVDIADTDGDMVDLELKGDANQSPDATSYEESKVDRVFAHTPHLGRAIVYLSSSWGIAAVAALVIGCLLLGLRRPTDPRCDDRASAADDLASGTRDEGANRSGRRSLARVATGVVTAALAFTLIWEPITPAIEPTLAYLSDTPKLRPPVDGIRSAKWFTCGQSMASTSIGSKPWSHLSFDERAGNTQLLSPYYKNTTGTTAWDGLYFLGSVWDGATLSAGRGRGCRRDTTSYSTYLSGSPLIATVEYIRHTQSSIAANGPSGNRWNTFSINVWYKTNVSGTDDLAGVLAAFSQAGSTEIRPTDRILYLNSSGHLSFSVGLVGAQSLRRTQGNYSDNVWHMATAVNGPNGMCLYLDSRLVGTCLPQAVGHQSDAATFWRFGYAYLENGTTGIDDGNVAQRAFKGFLDDASVWTRELTAAEVRSMYRAGAPVM